MGSECRVQGADSRDTQARVLQVGGGALLRLTDRRGLTATRPPSSVQTIEKNRADRAGTTVRLGISSLLTIYGYVNQKFFLPFMGMAINSILPSLWIIFLQDSF